MSELSEAVLLLCRTFESMGIPFAAGGSFASSMHGVARPTQDLDLIAEIAASQADALAGALQSEFYIEAESIRDAIRLGRSFNVIHLASAFKIDIFPASSQPLGRQELNRRRTAPTAQLGGAAIEIPVISAEDTILAKLRWYREGGEISERQWNDVRNIIEVQGQRLDRAYLEQWARNIGVSDLLMRLIRES